MTLPNILKKKATMIIVIIMIIVIVGAIILSKGNNAPVYTTVIAEKSDLKQEVSVTGTVKAANNVELAFEKPGKVSKINVKVGDTVKTGQLLASLTSNDLFAQSSQAAASLESSRALLMNYESALAMQQAKLNELKSGTRPEEMVIAEETVTSAQNSLANSQIAYENAKTKAVTDLQKQLEITNAGLSNSVNVGLYALFTITDIQNTYFAESTPDGYRLADAKSAAVASLLGGYNAGNMSSSGLNNLNGGAKALVNTAFQTPTEENINAALVATKMAMQQVRQTFNAISLSPLSTTDISNLNIQKGYVDTQITAIVTSENGIISQKATNTSTIATALATVNTAQSTLQSAQNTLSLKRAGSTQDQISAQEAQVQSAEANVRSQQAQIKYAQANLGNISAQISKNNIISPINGIVVMQDAKVGEITQSNITVIKVMTDNKFQIEANVAEVDIANVKVGDTAAVTLDAFGSDVDFEAKIILVAPAETIIDGVPTYKVTLEFTQENENIKSGLTANIDILTAEKSDILNIPQRTILRNNGDKIVRILKNGTEVQEVKVSTGIRGTNGNIEILKGLNVGDKIIISSTQK
ncbi:MAG: Efflux transporter, RND family, MFP subunit [Parcubacteria group bacterium GW2011_GWC2_38_7]|nr:MAG: Efflux transporter, RND family, MFP subunit [Parcubacteria group bacterium GW2011_GWC2_38_7]